MRNQTIRYLIVPGWQGSADDHWQSHWQRSLPNSARVEQADWLNPKREDWVAELQRSIASDPRPTILIAHSLGCITVAHWAAQAPVESLRRVRAAFLVAPADVERANCPPALQNFAPIPQHSLPFPSQLVGSDNDTAASAARAIELARDWGSDVAILSGAGHINVKSGHQRWEQGFAYLYRLQNRIEQTDRRRA
ncbi:alpha/beta hydrolase [Pseudomonas fluorescens]|uniref:Alpha/beta hydrolase n=1 Tax=Pseudomonas fluorescens TaxID=294 RepID=A0A944HCZ7_PSEFL|nr:alpha/beta hydrolase [Pseudomonas fluorescens]MBT2298461.1 alpha/beta hydrolase [Pseudomonas fluorescens]MBT2309987.1 alpha/beta hydrolase [Pseudomonas fluorescens]MBT2311010.1 alpha/beta hydrolase [Pseudomonas fluorescens]MBT2320055.1 alpha/beta hydrolase [Pseudomonas fluorescens]MBT2328917.1 alpha/beta hydrolase [Pseudomonas fluorescens]